MRVARSGALHTRITKASRVPPICAELAAEITGSVLGCVLRFDQKA
jgi:hypothetical protein